MDQLNSVLNESIKKEILENKEIKEIAKILCGTDYDCGTCPVQYPCAMRYKAEKLYNAGYRKATKIFEVVFENIVYNDDAGFDVLTKDRAEELAKQFNIKKEK